MNEPMQTTAGEKTVAFASYVDRNYLPGFEVLIKSLLLTNPWIDNDYVVLFNDLELQDIQRISLLYPKFTFRRVDPAPYADYAKGDETNYLVEKAYYILDAFRLRGYDRLVTLDVDMVVLGSVRELVYTSTEFGAVPQHFDSDAGRRINSGVMTFTSRYMTDEFVERMDAIGRAGEYELDRHDQGVLSAALGGDYTRLEKKFNLVKRAVRPGDDVPADTRILHYTGRFKPWQGGESGYEIVEKYWHDRNLNSVVFWRQYLAADGLSSTVAEHFRRCALPFIELESSDLDDLREASRRYRAEGDFGASYVALRALMFCGPPLDAGALRDFGVAAMALSKEDRARLALAGASANPAIAPSALAYTSELEWTYRNYDAATSAANEATRRHPTMRKPRQLLKRIKWSRETDGVIATGQGPRVGHVAFYVDHEGNFGDVMLPVAVRTAIEDRAGSIRWSSIHAHQLFDLDRAHWANENLDAIVIGGGGLFLPDTAPNGNSGWQWNVTDAALNTLEIPIIVYTVGYNVFPGQRVYGDRFATSVRLLVSKAAFVGLRNHGSVGAVREIVGAELADKVEYLPCVTTVYGDLTDRPATAAPAAALPTVLMNVAYDRKANRFGDGYADFVAAIADLTRRLEGTAQVRCLAHTKQDEQIVHDLRRAHGLTLPIDAVYGATVSEALDVIGTASVVIGMRGHAGMIPFGIGVPILSIISHAKLRYFLEDIDHPEWGFDATDPDLAPKLESGVRAIIHRREDYDESIATAQQKLREVVDAANLRVAALLPRDREVQ